MPAVIVLFSILFIAGPLLLMDPPEQPAFHAARSAISNRAPEISANLARHGLTPEQAAPYVEQAAVHDLKVHNCHRFSSTKYRLTIRCFLTIHLDTPARISLDSHPWWRSCAPKASPRSGRSSRSSANSTAAMPQINSETGPGICRRHPKLQDTLIAKLRIPSCQLITADELFRVTELPSLTFRSSLQPGDFAGLVNLQELRIRLEAGASLHADTFHGLERLDSLGLGMSGADPSHSFQGVIAPGAFRGLSNIKVLELRHQKDTNEQSSIPPFEHIETLERLVIRITDHVFLPNENHFSNLPNLTSLSLYINPKEPKFKSQYRLSQELFQNNVKLEQVTIEIWEGEGAVLVDRNTFLHLDQLQSLSLAIARDTEISLSPNSPLLKDIINGNQSPSGYTIIPPGAK